jgi:hypothetical protein
VYLVFVPSLFFPLSSSLSAHTSLGPVQTASKQAERIFFGDSGSEWSSAAALNSKLRSEACSHSPMSTGTGVLTHLHSGQFSMFFFLAREYNVVFFRRSRLGFHAKRDCFRLRPPEDSLNIAVFSSRGKIEKAFEAQSALSRILS